MNHFHLYAVRNTTLFLFLIINAECLLKEGFSCVHICVFHHVTMCWRFAITISVHLWSLFFPRVTRANTVSSRPSWAASKTFCGEKSTRSSSTSRSARGMRRSYGTSLTLTRSPTAANHEPFSKGRSVYPARGSCPQMEPELYIYWGVLCVPDYLRICILVKQF